MSPLTTRLDAILADPLAEARARGGIGFVGLDVPQDLAFALPTACVHLPWHADRPTPFADAWLESGFPGWARSILETWSTGAFDALRTVIFSRGDDASQRLYYYVRELQRRGRLAGPEARVLDVARIPRASSLRHTRDALVELAASLEVDEPALRVGIERANRLRDGFASLAAARGRGGAQ
ncbi:2-hydroxyacyl-CoA dehydratase, partial [bacterium]